MAKATKSLKDIALIFQGVGHVDLFMGERLKLAGKETEACLAITARHVDAGNLPPEAAMLTPAKVSSRLLYGKLRGLGTSMRLMAGDILVTSRGITRASNPLPPDLAHSGIPTVAAIGLLVVRLKDGEGQPHPLALRHLLNSEAAQDYFRKKCQRKPDGSIMLTKAVLGGLGVVNVEGGQILAKNAIADMQAEQMEITGRRLYELAKAIRLKSLKQERREKAEAWPTLKWELPLKTNTQVSEKTAEQLKRKKISERLVEYLKGDFSKLSTTDRDNLDAWKKMDWADGIEALAERLHRGDASAASWLTPKWTYDVMAEIGSRFESVILMNAGTGTLGARLCKGPKAPRRLLLAEGDEAFRAFGEALCKSVNPDIEVTACEAVSAPHLAASNAWKIGMMDLTCAAGTWGDTIQRHLSGSLALSQIIAHVPPGEFGKLKPCRDHIHRITQLPAITMASHGQPGDRSQQSLIVTLSAARSYGAKIEVIDATHAKVDAATRKAIATTCLNGDVAAGMNTYAATAKQLFDESGRWPGLLTATGNLSSAETMAAMSTRETLNDELAHKLALLEALRKSMDQNSVSA